MPRILARALACLAAIASFAFAGNEGYFTTYNHHIEKGEVEVMLMADFTSPSKPKREDDEQRDYFSQMIEIEYAPTEQLALELMLEGFEETGTGFARYTGQRYEARYRLFEREVPLNPMIYGEFEDLDVETRYKMEVSGWIHPPYEEDEDEEEPSREKIMETRLILSQDFGRWNVAFNWINESDLHSGETAFGYALGVAYSLHGEGEHNGGEEDHDCDGADDDPKMQADNPWIRPTSLNVELVGALGDTKKLDLRPSDQEHYLGMYLMFHIGGRWMWSVGGAIGLSDASDDLVRMMFGIEF